MTRPLTRLALPLLLSLILAASHARALDVDAALSSDTSWAIGDSPVNVDFSGTLVPAGVNLTIDPAVTVKFKGQTRIDGTLSAIGTSGSRITFDEFSTGDGFYIEFKRTGAGDI